MVRLTILGDIDLRSADGAPVGSVLSQPSRFGLLVYLAVEGRGGGVSRDRLLGVFWPDTSETRARQSLRTALHFLRRSLGPTAIRTHGDLVSLDPGAVRCDAVELMETLETGDLERGLRLYGGELLPGFHVDGGSVELERWLDDARTALRREAATAAWALAEQQERAGNPAGAGAWARTAIDHSIDDEAAVRRGIALMGRIGDRAGALAAYRSLARQLAEFDAAPSPETEAVLEEVRAIEGHAPGDRPVDPTPRTGAPAVPAPATPVGDIADPEAPMQTEEASTSELAPAGAGAEDRGPPWRRFASAAVSLVLVAAFYSLWGLNRVDPAWTMPAAQPVIQMEPLQDFSADGAAAGLAAALSVELAGRLSDTEQLVVVHGPGDPGDEGPAGPRYILDGGVLRSAAGVRATAMLLDAESGATLYRVTAEHELDRPAETVDRLATALAGDIRARVGRAVAERDRRLTADNPRALNMVTLAVRDMEVADSLRRAGAPEAAELALVAADSQLLEAQAMAPRWAEPPIQRGETALRRMWLRLLPPLADPAGVTVALEDGIRHADAALSVAPDDPEALELRGTFYYWLWLTRSGDSEEEIADALRQADADLSRATTLDGGLARSWSMLSAIREARGRFAAANLAAGRAYREDAFLENASEILVRLFTTSLEVGNTAAARRWCDEIGQRLAGSWLPGYCTLEALAWQDDPGVGIDSVHSLVDRARSTGAGAVVRPRLELLGAVVLARLGARHEALRAIERANQALASDPDTPDVDALKIEAWARLALGDEDAALSLLRRVAELNPAGARTAAASRRFATIQDRLEDFATPEGR